MGRTMMLVGIGGFVGSVLRYLLSLWIGKSFPMPFPLSTFIINIAGCLLIGIFYGFMQRGDWFNASLALLLITGFCGGFTTFSTFSFENLSLLRTGAYGLFFLYGLGSVALGLLAAWAGLVLVKALAG